MKRVYSNIDATDSGYIKDPYQANLEARIKDLFDYSKDTYGGSVKKVV